MTLYYFGSSIIMPPVTVESDEYKVANDSLSMRQDRLQGASQRWLVSFSLVPSQNFEPLAILMKGFTTKWNQQFPQFTPDLISLNYTMSKGYSAGDSVITVTSDVTDNLTVGRMVRFSGHSKMYMVTKITDSTTITIYPNLFNDVTEGETFSYGSNVYFKALITTDQAKSITFSDGIFEDYGVIKLMESV